MKRKICNFANASAETTRKGAIYQRGQYYVEMKTERARDPFKYAIFINDSLLGFTGQLANAKRFCQSVYLALPFETDVNESMKDVLERLRKKYKIRLRPSLKPNKQKKVKAAAKPKAQAKPKAKPKAKAKLSVLNVNRKDLEYVKLADEIEQVKEDIANSNIFTISDFNRVIRIQKRINDEFGRDAQLRRENEANLTTMMVKMNLDVLPTDEIVSLDELRSKKQAKKIKDERPAITAKNLKAIINRVFQCELTSSEGLEELADFKETKAVKDAKATIKGVKCRAENAAATNQKMLSRSDLADLKKKIQGTTNPKILRPIILDLSLKTVRTKAVEDLIKLAKRKIKVK